MARIYLDDAASAPLLPQVRSLLAALEWANPSSPHAEGRAARAALDRARDRAAAALGVPALDLFFCASGTQAVNLALLGAGRRLPRERSIVTWTHEHQAVLGAVRQLELEGRSVHLLEPDSSGRADPDQIPSSAGLISLGLANNEVGSLQPVSEVGERARHLGARFHLDACQGPRWLAPDLEACDLASFSGSKLGALGGLVYAANHGRLEPLWAGGPQELGRVPGREDLAAASALALALERCSGERAPRAVEAAAQAARLQGALARAGGRMTGSKIRLPNLASACFPGRRGEDMVMALDLAGLAVSSGSACASGSLDPSHVLLAMGFSLADAGSSLRLSVGWETSDEEVSVAESVIAQVLGGGDERG
ncbi:MAG TPA: aminotransferase class V-fold PLP-dependent enzyme [Candidatus Nitrosotalea sp.]|nr:aminotransferase class V-fold PLP-dependent enzyme [Candidatus Nitrosotalea sp.]